MLTKMFAIDAIKTPSPVDPNEDSTTTEDSQEYTTTITADDNDVNENDVDAKSWLQIPKINPKRRRVVSRR